MNNESRGRLTAEEARALEDFLLKEDSALTRDQARDHVLELAQELPAIQLDEMTMRAIDDGLKVAEEDPTRYTADEARTEARRLAKEWLKMAKQKSA